MLHSITTNYLKNKTTLLILHRGLKHQIDIEYEQLFVDTMVNNNTSTGIKKNHLL